MNKEDVLMREIIQVIKETRKMGSTTYLKYSYKSKIKTIIEEAMDPDKDQATYSYFLDKLEKDINKINYYYDDFLEGSLSRQGQRKRKRRMTENEVLFRMEIPLYKDLQSLYSSKDSQYLKEYVDLTILMEKIIEDNQLGCPICQKKSIDLNENDHFLPKSKFPTLAISRNNFLPTCTKCNNTKGNKIPAFPIYRISAIDMDFLDDYVDISINIQDLSEIEISAKAELKPLDQERVNNLLDLYNMDRRFTDNLIGVFCEKEVGKIVKETKKKINKLDDQISITEIRQLLEAEKINTLNLIDKDDSVYDYKKFLKKYITEYFNELEDFHVFEIYQTI